MGHPPRLARAAASLTCLLLLFATTVSANKCSVGCHGKHTGKSYQEGHTYVYDLEGLSTTSVTEAQGDATLKLKATVELTAKPNCVQQLRLKNVQVNGAPASSPDVEKHAVQFNYHDGHIDTELCTEPGDSQSSLNIKRAVVSLFQSAVLQESGSTTHHETDIFGGCPTDFSFHKEGDSVVVQKYRNLGQCSFRENVNQGLISGNFDSAAGVKSSPLLASQQKIEQRFKRGVLNKAVSTETYKYRPFSNGEAGAKTVIETVITLKGEKGDNPPAAVSQPKSLIFEAPHPVVKSSIDALTHALKAAKAEVNDGVKAEAAIKFAELVKVLRISNKNDILSVYRKVRSGAGFDKVADQKLFLQALFRAGSGEAAEVAAELINSHEITGTQALLFYASLSLIEHVNLPSVTAITALLNQPDLPRIGYLGIGQVIGKYCQQHSCENVPEIKNVIHKIREKVGNGKAKTREQENVVVSALKSLGNAKYLDDPTLQKLANIAADKNVRNRVRVAAIEALPTKCSMKWKSILLKVLADLEEDSEVRIKSYLSLVACPCPHVANNLKELLDVETVNQVGSFIQSHLRNLRASTDPNKQNAKVQLGLVKSRRKFPEDIRKFSFNNELSYNIDAFGVGSSAESNVIYSQNSFVPRSASLNLTTELFGRSFNFLELDTRVENLDKALEKYFGPKSDIMQYDLDDLSEDVNIDKMIKTGKETIEKTLRQKREVKQGELDKFAKNVHLRNAPIDEDLDLDISMKLFGVELGYVSYHGDADTLVRDFLNKQFKLIDKSVDAAKNFDYDLQNYLHFLEAELVYPTGLGASLSLGVAGTSVVHLKTSGKVDLEEISRNPKNAAFNIALEPSVVVTMTGNMLVKGLGAESGMKVVGTLHTATGSDIHVSVLNGKGIDIKFGIPKKKEELINVNSEVLFTSGQKGDKYVAPKFNKAKSYTDCFDQFSGILGLTICGEVSFPFDSIEAVQKKPLFPLSGPAKFAVTIENNDVSSYHFRVFYNTEDPKKRSFEILLDTPKSKTNRRIALVAEASTEPEKYVKISLDSPVKKASAEAIIKNTAKEHTLTVNVQNDLIQYFVRIGLLAKGSKYKPILEYKVPEHIMKLANAKTDTKGGSGQQYTVQGVAEVSDYQDGKKFTFDKLALVGNGRKIVSLDGFVTSTPNAAMLDAKVGYAEENVAIKMEGKKLGPQNYELAVSAMPSKDPNIGFNLKWKGKKEPTSFEHKLVFIHGQDQNSEVNRLTVEQSAEYKLDPKDFVLSAENKITYPAMNVVGKLEGKITPKTIKGDVEVKYDKFKFGTELTAKADMVKRGDYEVEFEAEILENSIELKSKRTVVDEHKSKFENSLELSPGGKYSADAEVTYDVSKNNVNTQLDGQVNLNGKKIKVDTGLETNLQSMDSHAIMTIDSVKYVDFLLKTRRAPNPNGSLKLILKNYLVANGNFVFKDSKGNAELIVDIIKVNRKIKATGDLAVSGSEHVANLEILFDAEKDPSKRVKFSTISDITKTSIDTKNILEVLASKLEFNAKGDMVGTFNEGKINFNADLTLPNGRYFVYKIKRNSAKKDAKYDMNVDIEVSDHERKGGKSSKVTYIAEAKDVDFRTYHLISKAELKYVNQNGKDLVAKWALRNLQMDDKKNVHGIEFEVYGVMVPKKFMLDLGAVYDINEGIYNAKSSLGDDFVLKSAYNLAAGNKVDQPCKAQGTVEVKLPNDKLRNLKFEGSVSLLKPTSEDGVLEFTGSHGLTYNDDKTIKLDSYLKASGIHDDEHPNEGQGKVTLTILKSPPLTIGSAYKYDPTGEKKKVSQTLNVNYGNKEATISADTQYLPDLSFVNLDAKCTLPFEKLRTANLHLVHKRENEGRNRNTEIVLTTNDTKYTLKSEVEDEENKRMVHAVFTCPNGNTELLAKFQKLGDREFMGEWKIHTPKGFIVADSKVNLDSVDDFVITVNFDSDKIKTRKIHAEIANKPTAKTGRRIIITVTSDGQNIVTGSTNYKKRDEDGKIIVEGNGNLKIGENTRSSSFKYTRQQLTQATDGEVGVAMVLNANFGPSAIVGELKLTNKEVHVFNSYCEQNKDCAHYKLQSIVNTEHKGEYKHQITVEVDLKKFNVPVEFGLKSSTDLKPLQFDQVASLYLHSSKDKSEYVYQFYIHPTESAIILTLPSRELAIISTYDVPKTRQTGAYKAEIALYLDRKNKPADKTSLSAFGDVNIDKNTLSLSGETKFVYPMQPKDMSVKGRLHYGGEHLLDANLDIDVFAKKSQKITVLARLERKEIPNGYNGTSVIEINSRGQQLKVDLKSHLALSTKTIGFGSIFSYNDQHQKPKSVAALFSADVNRVYLLVTSPNAELIKAESKMEFAKNLQKIDTELTVVGNKPVIVNFEAKDLNDFKYLVYSKENPNTKLTANGRMVLGQLAEVHADFYSSDAKKNLFHVLVHLDEGKFLKPEFGYSKENIIAVADLARTKVISLIKQLNDVSVGVVDEIKTELKDLLDHLKKAQPNIKPLLDYYQGELNKLKSELQVDETVKEIQAALNKHFGTIIAAVADTIKKITEQLVELQKQYNEVLTSAMETIKAVYPQLKESYLKLFHAVMEIADLTARLALTYLQTVLSILNDYQEELKGVLAVVSEIAQDFAKIVFKAYGQIKQDVEEFVVLLVQQMKALPVYEILKEKYQEAMQFQVPEAIVGTLEEFCNIVVRMLPTEELRRFTEISCAYVIKHIKHEKVDEPTEIKKIYTHAISAVQSILELLQSQASLDNVLTFFQTQVPVDFSLLASIPGISSLKISVLNLLRNQELPSPVDLYYTYRPTLYVSDLIPPFSHTATVTDGGHFFTFDGRHFTMPGSCHYILAQDMENGNFSIVANFNNGNLISVTVTEPKESITIKSNGNLLVNNKPADYPGNTKNLHAFLVKPFANIKSDYGVHVTCSDKAPMICAIRVSGFYHGKLRGLLGDGNNEPYDDYTLPSGKIATSETEFGNAYKLKPDCPAATAAGHAVSQRAPICTEYFSGQTSTLKSCFNYVTPIHYREACDKTVAANTKHGPCLIAAAYLSACYHKRVSGISIPHSCANCKVASNTVAVGDSFSVKAPQKEADVIFVVEQVVKNEKVFKDMVEPLMSELREELKHHGITDVYIGLIGFGEKMKWPQHYTLNGNDNIEGDLKTMKFDKDEPIVTSEDAKSGDIAKKLIYLGQRLDVELGTFKLTDAYEEAIRYPFRPGAAKAVVGVLANPCEKSPLPISLQHLRLLIGQKMYRDLGLTYYHVSFTDEMLVSGKPQKNIVGYDSGSVYTFADGKKKPLTGSSDLKNNLAVSTSDVCADFAVSSGGAAFSSDNFLEAKPNQRKQFVQVTARRIVDGLVNVEIEQDCSCEMMYGMIGRPRCKIVGRKEKEPLAA